MDVTDLLSGRKNCPCGKDHSCKIKNVIIKSGAIKELPALISEYKSVLSVSDENTFGAAGEIVNRKIGGKLKKSLVLSPQGSEAFLVPDERALEKTKEAALSVRADIIVGIGSGVINDICKQTAFVLGIPYIIVATAPSMDGYASKGAALILGGMKVTLSAREPIAIIGDADVLSKAPIDMIRAGIGDIIGKFSCLSDWKLSAEVNGEYFCDYVYSLTLDMAKQTAIDAEKCVRRDPEAIIRLTESLVKVGIGMAYLGNSRSASGSEHHLSHFFEITGLLDGKPYMLHGLDVGYASLYVQKLREKLLSLETLPESVCPPDEKERKRIYKSLYPSVKELQDKIGSFSPERISIYREKWEKIRQILSEAPSFDSLAEILGKAGFDYEYFLGFYGKEKLSDASFFAKDLKDRFTVLWILYDLTYRLK